MKDTTKLTIILVTVLAILFTSCAQQKKEILPSQMASVTRGDLILSISADGNLDMPHEVRLKFGTPGTVREIRVKKGDVVKAGTLLARLDNTLDLLTVESSQYALESAINAVLQSCCGPRYPTFYSLAIALMRFEQAQDEITSARNLLLNQKYYEAASNLSLASHDLAAARDVYANPKLDTLQTQYNELQQPVDSYPELNVISSTLNAELVRLDSARKLFETGDYTSLLAALDDLLGSMYETHSLVKRNSHLPGAYTYPDTSTSLAVSRQVLDTLAELQIMLEQQPFDPVSFSEKLRIAQHDLQMANLILDENETIYRAGLNPQTLRSYNINIENAMINLDRAKKQLLKSEILAPFDGTVVDVPVKQDDQLSQFDYSSKTAVHLVDTRTIKMVGIIDEIDITKVKVGQEALLTVDALPGQKLKGHVTFVSPFGTLMTGVVNFPVEIYLDPIEGVELRGGLTATADIIIGQRDNVLMVPNRAVKGLAGDYWVDVVTDPSSAATEKRIVKTGMQNKKTTEIISGLKDGERVLIEPVK
jgi:HlyD family secretion protein